jgi:ABC-type antimicrobial peptide transport system permease subunit
MLLIGFGLAALTLAGSGLYAVVAWGVRQRTRELGIRIAVGATPRRIKRLVLGETLGLIASGCAIGLVLALAGSKLLSAVLYHVSPTDPFAILAAISVLLAFGLLAGWVPAREATRVDPVRVLRAE